MKPQSPQEQPIDRLTTRVLPWVLFGMMLASVACVKTPLKVDVFVSPDLNKNNPLPVDVVAVCNPQLLKELLDINARQWFTYRNEFARYYKLGEDFQVWSWEWVPGQIVSQINQTFSCETRAILVFAAYRAEGEYRAYIRDVHAFRLEFHEDDFGVYPLEKLRQ